MKNKKRYLSKFFSILTIVFIVFANSAFIFAAGYQKPTQQDSVSSVITSAKNQQWADRVTEDIAEALETMAAAEQIIISDISVYDGEVSSIANAIKTLANSLLAIFVTAEILSEINRKGDDFRWEDSLRVVLKLLIIKNFIDMAPLIMNAMYNSVNAIITQLGTGGNSLDVGLNTSAIAIGEKIMKDIDECSGIFKGMQQSFIYVKFWIVMLGIKVCGLLVDVVAFARVIQLLMLKTLSPIPIVFCGWGETKDTTKRFALAFFAICLQGLVISVCFRIYLVILAQPVITSMSTTTGMLIATLVLAKSVMSSGNWAKELLGAG